MSKHKLCFVAGKSGGHIIPCLTIAQQYCNKHTDADILFFSANTPLDTLIISSNKSVSRHVPLTLVSANPQSLLHAFAIFWHVASSFVTSFYYLIRHRPSEIITTGGVVAIPPCLAAFFLRIPITLYSLDAVPGKAITMLSPFATTIHVCFKNSQKFFPAHKCTVRPFPLRYTQENTLFNREETLRSIGLDPLKKTIVILGGSQGSIFLNDCIKNFVVSPYFSAQKLNIIHQTGSVNALNWHDFYAQHNITAHVFSYHPHLASLYMVADVIICRAGAGTLFEIHFFNKQCIVIPLKTKTTSHQVDNAKAVSQEYPHLFQWIDQDSIANNNTVLFTKINELLQNTNSI